MFKILTIPFDRTKKGFNEDGLNKFVLNKHVKSYSAEFFQDGEDKYWTVFLEYDPVFEKTSGKEAEGFDEGQKLLLERLKAWRKEKADKEGVPVYIIGTNREFADIVCIAPRSLEQIKTIKGFGNAKVSKYGHEIIEIIKGFYGKT